MTSVSLDLIELAVDYPCQVKIDADEIVVSYTDDNEVVLYKGKNEQTGHFRLFCKKMNGRASLHKFDGENILEGSWIETGYEGFWKIELKDEVNVKK